MNKVLARWNSLDPATAAREVLPCCGSQSWANGLAAKRPILDDDSLFEASASVWFDLPKDAWQEAFNSHPRIGQSKAQGQATAESLRWSAQEQDTALSGEEGAKLALSDANLNYEQKFGRIFIVCASGKSASEILKILETRMSNDAETELREAAEQQQLITQLRLHRWLEST
jgi:2-oxo-4-hydroxy-4-carboxy-5-ureidoimidazoline decarboxylase